MPMVSGRGQDCFTTSWRNLRPPRWSASWCSASSCWLLVNYADFMFARQEEGRTWQADEYLQKRQDRAQKRFIHACKALAHIRRLLGPSIQVNVAGKQVNVIGRATAPTAP